MKIVWITATGDLSTRLKIEATDAVTDRSVSLATRFD
jgi:hypothetical protein